MINLPNTGMERDLAAIQSKLESLDEEAEKISVSHPEEAIVIKQRTNRLREVWDQLSTMLKERDEKLEEAGDLHRFLKNLDHFQTWLSKTESDIANQVLLLELQLLYNLMIRQYARSIAYIACNLMILLTVWSHLYTIYEIRW